MAEKKKRIVRRKTKSKQSTSPSRPSEARVEDVNAPTMKEREEAAKKAEQAALVDPLYLEPVDVRLAKFLERPPGVIPLTPKLISQIMEHYIKLTPEQFKKLGDGSTLSLLERGIYQMVLDHASGKSKTKHTSTTVLYNRMFGQPKNIQEISGPDGSPIHYQKQAENDLEAALEKMSDEELKEYEKLVGGLQQLLNKNNGDS